MDLPPREMKETIFSRQNQTALPLLANNRKDTLQALRTSFFNTAIDNMKDNKVLNNRTPPINDEKTLLSRRQRATLSQVCYRHCTLLNSHKKRLKQSYSSSCLDCGIDPQDVPHLFDDTAHPKCHSGSKRHSLQAVELSQWFQAAVQIVANLPAPSIGGPLYRFLGMPAMRTRWMAGAAAHKSG